MMFNSDGVVYYTNTYIGFRVDGTGTQKYFTMGGPHKPPFEDCAIYSPSTIAEGKKAQNQLFPATGTVPTLSFSQAIQISYTLLPSASCVEGFFPSHRFPPTHSLTAPWTSQSPAQGDASKHPEKRRRKGDTNLKFHEDGPVDSC